MSNHAEQLFHPFAAADMSSSGGHKKARHAAGLSVSTMANATAGP